RCRKWRAVDRHLLLAQLPQDGSGQNPLHEGVAVEKHPLAFAWRLELPKRFPRGWNLVEILPRRHGPNEFHERETSVWSGHGPPYPWLVCRTAIEVASAMGTPIRNRCTTMLS